MPKVEKHLYLLVFLPSEKVTEEILRFKEEIKTKFSVQHALKLPAHITLQSPFWMADENEQNLHRILNDFSKSQQSFSVYLNGFDHFSDRVIFVKISNHEPIIRFYQELQQQLPSDLFLSSVQQQRKIHPHITLATRDLKKEIFPEVWREFQNRTYKNSFPVEGITLFKHNRKVWIRQKTFFFDH